MTVGADHRKIVERCLPRTATGKGLKMMYLTEFFAQIPIPRKEVKLADFTGKPARCGQYCGFFGGHESAVSLDLQMAP